MSVEYKVFLDMVIFGGFHGERRGVGRLSCFNGHVTYVEKLTQYDFFEVLRNLVVSIRNLY